MASRRRAREPAVEWSCPLCTLLNHWRDRRCAACDQEREPQPTTVSDDNGHGEEGAAQQKMKRETVAAASGVTAPIIGTPLAPVRTLRGVFFSSATTAAATTTQEANNWRQEPRLKVNRRKRPLALKTPTEANNRDTSQLSGSYGDSQSTETQAPNFSLLGSFGGLGAAADGDAACAYGDVHSSDSISERVVVSEQQQQVPLPPLDQQRYVQSPSSKATTPPHDAEPVDDSTVLDEEDESQPCFQLLGPNTSMFAVEATISSTPVDESEHLQFPATASINNSSIRDVPFQDMTAATEYTPPSFNVIDVRSPSARLPPPAAECQRRTVKPVLPVIPKSVLQQGFVAASRISHAAEDDSVVEAKLAQAGLDLSDSDSDENNSSSRRLLRNKLRRNCIVSPEPAAGSEEEEKKAPAVDSNRGGTWECPICTNFNSCALVRCELCDTKKGNEMNCIDGLTLNRHCCDADSCYLFMLTEDDMESAETSNNNDSNDNDSDQYIDLAMSQEEEATAAAAAASDAPNYYGFDARFVISTSSWWQVVLDVIVLIVCVAALCSLLAGISRTRTSRSLQTSQRTTSMAARMSAARATTTTSKTSPTTRYIHRQALFRIV